MPSDWSGTGCHASGGGDKDALAGEDANADVVTVDLNIRKPD